MICTAVSTLQCSRARNNGIDFIFYITQYDIVYLAKELKGNNPVTAETASSSSKGRMAGSGITTRFGKQQ